MSFITIIWSICAGICLGLAGVNAVVSLRARDRWENLFFSIGAAGAAATAVIELALMHAQTAAESGLWLRWMHTSVTVIVIALIWFVRAYLGAGSLWLAWLSCGLRALTLVINFLPGHANIVFREMNPPRQIVTWGESLYVPNGIGTGWSLLVTGTSVLFVAYLVGAVIAAWRQGNRGRAGWLGLAVSLSFLLGMTQTRLVTAGLLSIPYTMSLLFLPILSIMGIELSSDLLRAFVLSRALRESQERLQLATSAADLGVWDWNIFEDSIHASGPTRARLGLKESDPLSFSRYLQSVYPDDRAPLEQAIHGALRNGVDLDLEYRVVNQDGKTRWIAVRGRGEGSPGGKSLHLRGVSMDITKRKQAELEVRKLHGSLAQVQRASTLGLLASALAHEINQPLGAILRNAEAGELFLQQQPPDLAELQAILLDIRRDDQRAGAVIDRLRLLLKHSDMEFESLCLCTLLDQVAKLLQVELQGRRVRMAIECPGDLPQVRGDRIQLQQVLLNLLLNSLDALNGQPPERQQIAVGVRRIDDATVEVAVRDNGRGLPPQEDTRIFEPFFTTKAKGLGMGLAISQTIIESHGGRIWAETNPEGGATFRFTLKVAGGEGQVVKKRSRASQLICP